MPVTINLGRINTCKIVGTKNRFIEVRCKEEPAIVSWDCDPVTNQCVDYGFGTGVYTDANSGGNPGDGLAACIAAPFVNTCITGGQTNSGLFGSAAFMYSWLVTNGYVAVNTNTFYFEGASPCTAPASINPCYGPNGGCLQDIDLIKVVDDNNVFVFSGTTINNLIAFLNGLGIAVTNTDDFITVHTAIKTYYKNVPGSGLALSGSFCECTGCGSPSGVSFDCVQGAAGPYCTDPGNGSGQYSTLAICNAALAGGVGNDDCSDNSDTGGARVNATPGTIYATPQEPAEYFHTPAIVNQNLNNVYFECYDPTGHFCNNGNPNYVCCEGPNSTAANPTYKVYKTNIGYNWMFFNTDVQRQQGACPGKCPGVIIDNSTTIPFLNGDVESYYGVDAACNPVPFSWNDILQDAIAAGVPGVTTSTPFATAGGAGAPGTLAFLMTDWFLNNPAICAQYGGDAMITFEVSNNPGATLGPYPGICKVHVCTNIYMCYCEDTCASPTYDCDPVTQQCYDPFPLIGPYTGPTALNLCQAAGCGGPTPSWDCVNGNCQDPGTGAGQYTTYAACIASLGANTCASAVFTPAFAQPYCASGDGLQYNYMVSNGFTNVPLTNYKWEICTNINVDACLGPNGFDVNRFYNFIIQQQGIFVHIFPTNATIDDLVAWCNTNIGPGFTNTMTYSQINQYSYTFPGWEKLANTNNIRIQFQPCECSDCGGTDLYDCVSGGGCQVVAGGQYATLAACQAANAPIDSCDTTTVVPTPQANPLEAALELTTNYPTIDVTTLSTQIVAGADPCRPPLLADQTHCIGKEGHPMYTFTGYTFIDSATGAALTGLATSYTKWTDFLTAAQAIPITGISGSTTFNDACSAVNSHYTNGVCTTCPIPLDNDVVPGVWDYTNGVPGPNSLGVPANGFNGINGIFQYITTQANGYTGKNAAIDFGGVCTPAEYTIVPAVPNTICNSGAGSSCSGQTPDTAPNGCYYVRPPLIVLVNFVLPNGPYYTNWDALLADLVADGCPGVTLTSTYCDIFVCSGGTNTVNKIQSHYGSGTHISLGTGQCLCGTSTVTPKCSIETECCVCEEGCPRILPPARGECLTLWLHADRIDTIQTTPSYPAIPPSLGGTTYYIREWHNLAYDINVGVYPHDPTAFYTYDTITPDFTTAPILDETTFAPHKAIMFDEIGNNQKFLIANPTGPAVLPLEPDTNPNAAYDKGWTIFFRRCTTQKGWVNAKSFFMGDDWTQTTPGSKEKASGLKPHGQPYCRSVMFGHNHADESVPSNQYDASYINENNPAGGDLYLPEGCYTHWVKACETKPTGTTNNTFMVMWGIGPLVLFKDIMADVNMDMILQNINTRNRSKLLTQSGWYQEIRAYNCCFDKDQIKTEYLAIDAYWGNTLIPQQLPLPCGGGSTQVGNVFKFDGVDQTRVEVVEAGGNESILPSNQGFTAAFWVRMDDCVDDDVCFFEKGINLPGSNEEVAFRLYLTDDAGQVGNLYWDVFGDAPVSYNGNYSRTISNTPWLGESSCANLIGKWKHVAVTMEGIRGLKRKIYVNGVDITGVNGGALASGITGKVRRNSTYPLVIGDSSRPDYTFKGDFSQFMTWNKSLSLAEIQDVYNNGGMWAPNADTDTGFSNILGIKPYEDKNRLTFYTNFDSDPITHETQHSYTITKYGGVTLENTTDVDNAVLPTDIAELQCWFRANTKQLFDLDYSNNKISRATYMVGNTPHLKDKIRIWECHGSTGRFCMPDSVNTQADKMLYQQTTEASAIIVPGGLYSNGSKQLQIFHTRADGGIQFPAADGTLGAFTIMVKIRLEAFSNEAVYGNTTDNMMRVNNTTAVRYKIGGAGSADFTVPSAMTDAQPYIFTLQRDAAGVLSAYIDGGAFTDQALTGSFTDTDAFVIDYLGGVPSQGMQGWIFDFIAWGTKLNDPQRQAQYRTINQTIRTL